MVAAGSRRVLVVSGLVWLVFAILFFGDGLRFSVGHVERLCGQAPLDVRFTSSASDVDRFLTGCGPEGRTAYRDMQVADLFYPAVVGLFMASALAASVRRPVSRPRLEPRPRSVSRSRLVAVAATVPLVGSAFDYLENALAWSALLAYPEPIWTSSLLGLASAVKTTSFWLAGVILVLALADLLIRSGRRAFAARRSVVARQQPGPDRSRSIPPELVEVGTAR